MPTPFVSILSLQAIQCCFHAVVAGSLMTQLLPLLMMRHRRVPRAKWVDHITPNGKHWIEHVCSLLHICMLKFEDNARRQICLIGLVRPA